MEFKKRGKRYSLPDKFVVELVVAARGRQERVAVGDEKVENDGGLQIKLNLSLTISLKRLYLIQLKKMV